MNQRRLFLLLAAAGVLGLVRLAIPALPDEPAPSIVEATVRKTTIVKQQPSRVAGDTVLMKGPVFPPEGLDVPGNAFAVRPPPAPPYVAPVAVAKVKPTPTPLIPAATAVAATIAAAPPPPAPFQVIGTWDDGKDPGVFLANQYGTLLARTGSTLQAEYKVLSITPSQIALVHMASKREFLLAVTRPPTTPTAYP